MCVYAEHPWVLREDEEAGVKGRMRDVGFEFVRVVLPPDGGEGGEKRKREQGLVADVDIDTSTRSKPG